MMLPDTILLAAASADGGPLPGQLALGCVALVLAGYLAWHYVTYGNNHGRPMYPFVGCLPDVIKNFHRHHDRVVELFETSPSGTLFNAFPGEKELATVDPAHVEYILKDSFQNYPKGPLFLDLFRDLLGEGIFNSDGDQWKQQRKVASFEFSTNSLRNMTMASVREGLQTSLLPTLEATTTSGNPIDVQDAMLKFTFSNICRVGFGVDPDSLTSDPDSKWYFMERFDAATKVCMMRFLTPRFVWQTMRAWGWGSEGDLQRSLKVVDSFAEKVIKQRRQDIAASTANGAGKAGLPIKGLNEKSDILSRMIALGDRDHGQLFSDRFLRDACINFVLAGRDTSAVAMSWLFWLLSQHPTVEAKIVEEAQSILKARKAAPASILEPFSYDELKKMTYLHAAVNECLRLYPPVPNDMKECMSDDVLPGGIKVYKGWHVTYCMYAMGRMTRLWGPDARDFKPERWLIDDGQVKLESPFKFPIFNAGPRLCLGKDMAYMQIKSVVAFVLLHYKLTLVPGHEVATFPALTLHMKNGLQMHISKRDRPWLA